MENTQIKIGDTVKIIDTRAKTAFTALFIGSEGKVLHVSKGAAYVQVNESKVVCYVEELELVNKDNGSAAES